MNLVEKKMRLWADALATGWVHVSMNCLYRMSVVEGAPVRFRLNFRDDKVLKLEVCRVTTEDEKLSTGRSSFWVPVQEASYTKVKISGDGLPVFEKTKRADKKKR